MNCLGILLLTGPKGSQALKTRFCFAKIGTYKKFISHSDFLRMA